MSVGPAKPLRVERDETAQLECTVDAKPGVSSVKWTRAGRFIDTNFRHVIPRVTLQDAGAYVCSADNGLGQAGSSELVLDVQHGPIVELDRSREAREGEALRVDCEVRANPRPARIRWFKEGDEDFEQAGATLRLNNIGAEDNGRYTCSATNYIQPTGRTKEARTGNATISINVRHRPGKAFILPDKPTAVEGKSVTLTCGAKPEGFPRPTFRWWKHGSGSSSKAMAVGSEFTIDSTRLSSAGKYYCQAFNDLGEGEVASTFVDVYQAPELITKLQQTIEKRSGDTGFIATCSAVGKPKPRVRWFKDGSEIEDAESNMYQVSISEQEAIPNMAYNVLSILEYIGPERIGSNQLMPTDRGHYTCQFENEVDSAETSMLLRIRHSPVVVHHHNKVAYDLKETAFITCRFQAFPSPRFDWTYGNSILQNDRRNYETNMTALEDDIYEGVLKITRVSESSYGDYICKGTNSMGAKRTIIKLQPKSKPEKPTNIRPVHASFDTVTLEWDEGFDGGFEPQFTIQYKKADESSVRYQDCAHRNPCNITGLEQHTQYLVKVMASNIRGDSKLSREIQVMTKVDVSLIPRPDNVHYARMSKTAFFNVLETALPLVAMVELENPDGTWAHYKKVSLAGGTNLGSLDIMEETINNLRVRLCLESNDVICGPYSEDAALVNVSPTSSGSGGNPAFIIGITIFVVVVAIVIFIVIVKCCCCSNNKGSGGAKSNRKGKKATRPDIVHPNLNMSYGIENKGVDTVKDANVVDHADGKMNNVYSVQQQQQQKALEYNPTTGYPVEQSNSNSNSANGGSVNSQVRKRWGKQSAAATLNSTHLFSYRTHTGLIVEREEQRDGDGPVHGDGGSRTAALPAPGLRQLRPAADGVPATAAAAAAADAGRLRSLPLPRRVPEREEPAVPAG